MIAVTNRLSNVADHIRIQTVWGLRQSVQHLHRSPVQNLTPYDVNNILQANEFSKELVDSSVKCYDSNQLASNNPVEDRRSEATCLYTPGMLMGVFDGHAGPSCAQIICKRLMRYVAASLLPPYVLKQQLDSGAKSSSFLKCHNDKVDFIPEVDEIYERSFSQYARELCNENIEDFQISRALQSSFERLDQDISNEAQHYPSMRTLSVAMSGAVTCVAHIDGVHLHVAGTGDCSAILGSLNEETGQWVSKKLINEHNSDNADELRRITGEHPLNERDTVIRNERLLGELAPLRAFGDVRYKWTAETLKRMVAPYYGDHVVTQHYHTPPYLTAQPDIGYHILRPRDRFMVLATDGLFDMLSPSQVVRLVGEHMLGKAFLQPLQLPKRDVTLGEVSKMLTHRRAGLKKKPLDKNGATHLIRNALGGTEYGIEHSKLAHMLSLPHDIVRLFRDDITVTVIYFNQDYIRHCTTT